MRNIMQPMTSVIGILLVQTTKVVCWALTMAIFGVGVCSAQCDFNKINENTSHIFLERVESGDTVFFPMPCESIDMPFHFRPAAISMDSILYVGYSDPNETLFVEDTTCYFGCNIVVVNNGVLIVRNSSVQIYGSLVAVHNGRVVVDSSELRLMSAYEWQFSVASLDSAEIIITDSEFDYGGYPGYTFIQDNSSLYVENSDYTATTAIYSNNARVTYTNVTGAGEYSARDSSIVHFSNVEYAMIHVQVPESTSLNMDFATDTLAFVEHWEVNPSSPFVSGTGYTFIIDSSYCMFNPSCASFSELTIEDNQCDILVRFTQDVCDTISGLVNHTLYDDWLVPIDDRTIHLVNTTVTCWHMQMFSTSNISIENSIVGEFICFDSSEAHLSNSIHDGTGGPLTAGDNSQVFVSYSDIRPNTVKARNNGSLVLNMCTVWGDFVVADSAIAVLLSTFNLNPIRVFDAGAAIVAAIKSPAAALIDDNISIMGDAYIERTPTSTFDFDAYRIYYVSYPIDTIIDIDSLDWIPITDWVTHQVRDDTLAVWNTSGFEAGRYFLKLDWRESSTGLVVYTFYMVNLREGTSVEKNSLRPEEFTIDVYPNPFNSSCAITVSGGRGLASQTLTNIKVYDLRGNVVYAPSIPRSLSPRGERDDATVWDGSESPSPWGEGFGMRGKYIWQPDKSIASGIYLVRATTKDGQTITKQIVYLK